jgi:hypothetical protein
MATNPIDGKALKAIDYRIASLKLTLELAKANGLNMIVSEDEARLDELETLRDYLTNPVTL